MTRRSIHFVSLGCPKNRVDSERMIAVAGGGGWQIVDDPACAEVILVNTCGFVEQAKQESIDVILEMAAHKQRGRCVRLIVSGCLSQRYGEELAAELPEIDQLIGTADLPRLAAILAGEDTDRARIGPPEGLAEELYPRLLSGSPHVAYLKIAEGCNRPCAFCVIPSIRGAQRSRTIPSLVAETRELVAQGARELVLIAQDTTAYGSDLDRETHDRDTTLIALLGELDRVDGLRWIRVLYAYPSLVTPALAEAMAGARHAVPYLDLPIQHVDDALLARMKRGYTRERVTRAIATLRAAMPDVALRTTLICGHPGETAAAHAALLDFLDEAELDHVGAFAFSAEEGSDAATQPDQVPPALAAERTAEVMARQQAISRRKLARLRGQTLEVIVDGPSPESEYLLQGRHRGQAPEVDGVVTLTDGTAEPGAIVQATVTDSADYDLVATLEVG